MPFQNVCRIVGVLITSGRRGGSDVLLGALWPFRLVATVLEIYSKTMDRQLVSVDRMVAEAEAPRSTTNTKPVTP